MIPTNDKRRQPTAGAVASKSDAAIQQKLNAIADGPADLMSELSADHPELLRHRRELTEAVGLENRESAG
ncbi:hypothetical protein NG2371_02061 [Nocardia gamkensis]|nr:hypothetical protein [Nocardia gamkensis]